MKKKIILLLALSFARVSAQEVIVEIKILDEKKGNYWVQVADRNCGAKSNGINSYGEYYSWSTEKNVKVSDEASKACAEFRGDGGHTDWRLPNSKEVLMIMNKCKREENYAVLKNEREDTTSVIFFPYAGMMSQEKGNKPYDVGKFGCFWGQNSFRSNLAISFMLSKIYCNNPLEVKQNKLSVRCVRTVK
ncbi:MAG: DUF1566 domain-containing protein [Mucinivorans sp.]